MMGINLGGLPKWLAKGLAATMGRVGGWFGEAYMVLARALRGSRLC